MTARRPLVLKDGNVGQVPTGDVLTLLASTAAAASLNAPHGTAPSSPVDGDVWTTTAGVFVQVDGVTVGPLGANIVRRVVQIDCTDPNATSALTVGDGLAYFRVPAELDGMNLVAVAATVTTASASGGPVTVQIANATDGVDMLSTKLTIDDTETDSITASTPAVIDMAHDDVATADLLRIDLDGAGSGAKGLIITLSFRLP